MPQWRPYWAARRAFALYAQVTRAAWRVTGDQRFRAEVGDSDWYVRARIFERAKQAHGDRLLHMCHSALRQTLAVLVREIRVAQRARGSENSHVQ